jgi:hypothetical protein
MLTQMFREEATTILTQGEGLLTILMHMGLNESQVLTAIYSPTFLLG